MAEWRRARLEAANVGKDISRLASLGKETVPVAEINRPGRSQCAVMDPVQFDMANEDPVAAAAKLTARGASIRNTPATKEAIGIRWCAWRPLYVSC